MKVELKPRTFGEILGLSFRLPVAHFGKLFVIFVILGIPNLLMQLWYQDALLESVAAPDLSGAPDPTGKVLLLSLGYVLVVSMLGYIQQGASILAVSASFTGKRVSTGTCITESLRRILSLAGYALVLGALTVIGMLTLGVLSLYWSAMFAVGPCAIMIERMRMSGALTRSRELTDGSKWQVLGLLFLTTVLAALIAGAAEGVIGGISGAAAGEEQGQGIGATIVQFLVTSIVTMPAVIAPVAIYFDLRVRKEAFDVETLSSLVDAIALRGAAETAGGGGGGEGGRGGGGGSGARDNAGTGA